MFHSLSGFLIVTKNERKYGLSGRFVSKKPALGSNEIAIEVNCKLPAELFTKPQLRFQIDIPEGAVPRKTIDANVIGNIKELIQQNAGIEITLIAPQEED